MGSVPSWPFLPRQVWFWNRGGYYFLNVDEGGTPSVPAGERAWQALIAHAPNALLKAALEGVKQAARAVENGQGQTGPAAAVRFQTAARQWLWASKVKDSLEERNNDG